MSIETVFSEVFREGGYEDVHAEPAPYRDFKIKWERTRGWISLEVSDYLSDAPDEVLEGIARTVLARIRDEDTDYPPEIGRHLSSQGFRDAHRETFIRRIPSVTFGRGLHADLDDAVAWLRDRGLPVPEDTLVAWCGVGRVEKSVLFRVVLVPRDLDAEGVDAEALARVIWPALCEVSVGWKGDRGRYDELVAMLPEVDG